LLARTRGRGQEERFTTEGTEGTEKKIGTQMNTDKKG
jgi:hypothetical protein